MKTEIALSLLAIVLVSAFGSTFEAAVQTQESPVVVELFTSQSCSSCPAADQALRQLIRQRPRIIALSCHVTYWDHLDWKDTLSLPGCTERQRAYSEHSGGDRRVYTPQMVVNGMDGFVGSSQSEAARAIAEAGGLRPISISRGDGETLVAQLPGLSREMYSLQTFGYVRDHLADIRRGENRGKQLRYTNSVVHIGEPEDWDGRATEKVIAIPDEKMDGMTILVQSRESGVVRAVGDWRSDRSNE